MYRWGWIIFGAGFVLSELVIKKRTLANWALRGFCGGMLISLVCFFLLPEAFSESPVITGLLMLSGAFLGEVLYKMGACETMLWLSAAMLFGLGLFWAMPFIPMGGGALLYMGCMMVFDESIHGRIRLTERVMGVAGFIFITALGLLRVL